MIVAFINLAIFLLTPFAGPYRALAYKFRTFGNMPTGAMTWLGIALFLPIYVHSSGPDPLGPWWANAAWATLALAAYAQATASWSSGGPDRDEGRSHCWLGRGEPLLALIIMFSAQVIAGGRTGDFFLFGALASGFQVLLVGVKRRCQVRATLAAAHQAACTPVTQAPHRPRHRAMPDEYSYVRPVGPPPPPPPGPEVAVFAAVKAALAHAWPKPQPVPVAAADGVVYMQAPRPSFTQWLRRHLVLKTMIWLIGGTFGIQIIPLVLGLACALPLWAIGADVHLPKFVTAPLWGFFERAKAGLEDKEEEIKERFGNNKEEIAERLRLENERLKAKLAAGAEKAQDKAGEVARKTFWGGLGW